MEALCSKNHQEFVCKLHGEYKKFITDSDKNCPYCKRDDAQKNRTHEGFALSKHFGVVSVVIECAEHGTLRLNVPESMKEKLRECPRCVGAKRTDRLKPKIKNAVDKLLKDSGIPVNYLEQRFSGLDALRSPKQQKIVARLSKYVLDLKALGDSRGAKNILLSGNMGTGKTLYASILLKEILSRSIVDGVDDEADIKFKGGMSAYFISEPELMNSITATWKSDSESTKNLLERLSSKGILCIDDVGAVTNTNTHLLDFYASLIDERYKRRLPTVITSNLNADDLRIAIGVRSVDRLFEKDRIIIANFDWNGYRAGTVESGEIEIF